MDGCARCLPRDVGSSPGQNPHTHTRIDVSSLPMAAAIYGEQMEKASQRRTVRKRRDYDRLEVLLVPCITDRAT